ncbi:hypothetical protein D3C84_870940 [compost metagenome]
MPKSDSVGVIPVDKPTVPNAEVASNSNRRNSRSSVAESSIVTVMTSSSEIIVMVNALKIRSRARRYLNSTISSLPRIIAMTAPISVVNVVVLMPPPVEPGDAPINIRMTMKKIVACRMTPISIVLAPAVRGVTDWNMAAHILAFQFSEPSVLLLEYSNIKMTTAPITSSAPVMDNTTFEWSDSLLF